MEGKTGACDKNAGLGAGDRGAELKERDRSMKQEDSIRSAELAANNKIKTLEPKAVAEVQS